MGVKGQFFKVETLFLQVDDMIHTTAHIYTVYKACMLNVEPQPNWEEKAAVTTSFVTFMQDMGSEERREEVVRKLNKVWAEVSRSK